VAKRRLERAAKQSDRTATGKNKIGRQNTVAEEDLVYFKYVATVETVIPMS